MSGVKHNSIELQTLLTMNGGGTLSPANGDLTVAATSDDLILNAQDDVFIQSGLGSSTKTITYTQEGKIYFPEHTAVGTTSADHDGQFNVVGLGDNKIQIFFQHNEIMVFGSLIGSAGKSSNSATLVFETNHLRACTIEMETSGHKYNNGADFWQTRHFYTCMSEGENTRINGRVSNHEFAVGGTDRMTTALNKVTGSNLWNAVITTSGEYQGNFHFRLQGFGAANCPTACTIT